MPKSLFRDLKPPPDPATLELQHAAAIATRKARFLALVDRLIEKLELNSRIDIREEIAALALIEKVLGKEKDDESNRGSAVREYAPEFRKKASHGAGQRAGARPEDDEPGWGAGGRDSGPDGGEPDESGGDEDDAGEPAVPAA